MGYVPLSRKSASQGHREQCTFCPPVSGSDELEADADERDGYRRNLGKIFRCEATSMALLPFFFFSHLNFKDKAARSLGYPGQGPPQL